jgi:hypothetical protein
MAETGNRQATEEIQVAIAGRIVQIGAMATHERQRHAAVVIDQIGVREFDDFRIIHDSNPLFIV